MLRPLAKLALAFGLVAAAQSSPAFGQGMMMRGMGGLAGLQVLSSPSGQKELSLSEEQTEKLVDIQQNIRSTMMEKFQGVDLQNMTEEERRETVTKIAGEVSSGVDKEIKDILNEEQYTRYKQISLQALGIGALAQEDVADKLKLSDDQKTKVQEILGSVQEESRAILEEARANGDIQAVGPKMQAVQEKAREQGMALLSDEQKATWKEMTGEPFKIEFGRPGGAPGRRID